MERFYLYCLKFPYEVFERSVEGFSARNNGTNIENIVLSVFLCLFFFFFFFSISLFEEYHLEDWLA